MTDNKNVKVDIIEILNNAKGLDNIKLFCEEVTQKNVTIIKMTDIINLLNSQKAEIERLNTMHSEMCIGMKVLKKTAIKEYKEKVKAILMDKGIYPVVVKNALNEAEKEMAGENN